MAQAQNREELKNYLDARWGWITEDVREDNAKFATQMVLENSYNEMVKTGRIENHWLEKYIFEDERYITEAPQTSYAGLGASQVIPRVMFPIIKRMMPSLYANKMVSVQPIEARTGVIYHIDYRFSNTKGNVSAGNSYTGNDLVADDENGVLPRFYSSEKFGPYATTISGAGAITYVLQSSDTPVSFFVERGVFADAAAFGNASTGYLTVAKKGVDSYGVRTAGNGFTAYVNGVRNATVEAALSFNAAGTQIVATGLAASFYNKQVIIFWSYEQEGTSYMNEMDFTLASMPVETVERKMKVRWTKESEQDMQRYHKIDVESELVKIATNETSYEQDREIIDFIDLIVPSQLNRLHTWSAGTNVSGLMTGNTLTTGATTDGVSLEGTDGTNPVISVRTVEELQNVQGNFLDKHRLLAQRLFELGALMAQYNRQGSANWAYVGPQMASLLRQLPAFDGDIFTNNSLKIQEFGSLNAGALTIYSDLNRPAAEKNTVLLGHKSTDSEYGAGVVFSPYMQWMSDTVVNPENFDNVRGFFSRYAITKVVRGQWHYAKMNLLGADFYA